MFFYIDMDQTKINPNFLNHLPHINEIFGLANIAEEMLVYDSNKQFSLHNNLIYIRKSLFLTPFQKCIQYSLSIVTSYKSGCYGLSQSQ